MLGQYVLPHHSLSRLAGLVAECRWPWFKNRLIGYFINSYGVNMDEAENPDPTSYAHFNDFFTRALKADARSFVQDPGSVACPVDGAISQLGNITDGRIFQAKGHSFSTRELIGGSQTLAEQFDGGSFTTIYLSPKDYHRIHMPVDGVLKHSVYVPGRLFSVSPLTTSHVPGLFARNERLVCLFETAHGPMAMILVGAMIVASIETVWAGLVAPPKRQLRELDHHTPIQLNKGDEMGRFKLGSTVILLFGRDSIAWHEQLQADDTVTMGQLLASAEERADATG